MTFSEFDERLRYGDLPPYYSKKVFCEVCICVAVVIMVWPLILYLWYRGEL